MTNTCAKLSPPFSTNTHYHTLRSHSPKRRQTHSNHLLLSPLFSLKHQIARVKLPHLRSTLHYLPSCYFASTQQSHIHAHTQTLNPLAPAGVCPVCLLLLKFNRNIIHYQKEMPQVLDLQTCCHFKNRHSHTHMTVVLPDDSTGQFVSSEWSHVLKPNHSCPIPLRVWLTDSVTHKIWSLRMSFVSPIDLLSTVNTEVLCTGYGGW